MMRKMAVRLIGNFTKIDELSMEANWKKVSEYCKCELEQTQLIY